MDSPSQKFTVTIEDCQRWIVRLQKMAKSLENKENNQSNEDNIAMLQVCSVLVSRLGQDIQNEEMVGEATSLFGKVTVGEA